MQRLGVFAIFVLLLWSAVRVLEFAPALRRPWTPAQLTSLDGPATAAAQASVRDDPRWCRTLLRASGVAFEVVPDRTTGPGCGFASAVKLTGPLWRPRGPVMTCPLAVALTLWERKSLRPGAARAGGRSLTTIEHFGTYSCRPIAGSSRQSEHATANAIDIAGVEFGNSIAHVRTDWARGTPSGRLLHRAHDDACQLFGTVLGPGYNAAHRDHLHLDMARWHYCP